VREGQYSAGAHNSLSGRREACQPFGPDGQRHRVASRPLRTVQTVYNASKSFVQSFALALRSELKDTGVTVTR
jgi:NAD(P)-dependent dehydrogenase (short-subunit alcohol dehydrogenase family)